LGGGFGGVSSER